MQTIALKLILTPLLIAGASAAARRWGPTVGGWIVALPLTSGPVVLYLALDHGTAFATTAATASLAGNLPIAAFCLAYALVARRGPWPGALLAASGGWIALAVAVQPALALPVPILFAPVLAGCAVALRWMPPGEAGPSDAEVAPWDVPFRVVLGTSFVVGVTAVAPYVGPTASGLMSMIPIVGSVLTTFAHSRDGAPHAIGILRGILTGLFGTATFHAILATALVPLGIGPAFGLAIAATILIQAIALRAVRQAPGALAAQPAVAATAVIAVTAASATAASAIEATAVALPTAEGSR